MQGIIWDMWDHRNSVLHGSEDNFHYKILHQEADHAIHMAVGQGTARLLIKDRKLVTGKKELLTKPLMDKQHWLDRLLGARKAWQVTQDGMPNFDQERSGLQNWLGGGQLNPLLTQILAFTGKYKQQKMKVLHLNKNK